MSALNSEQKKKKTLIKVYQKRKFLDSTIRYFVTKIAHLIKGERYTL